MSNIPCPCPGECPENCSFCIYLYCNKPVDYALVLYRYHHEFELGSFDKWFGTYFKYSIER